MHVKYVIKVCKKEFADKSNLNKHMTVHSGEKAYECNICNKSLAQSCNRDTHMKTHTMEYAYNIME